MPKVLLCEPAKRKLSLHEVSGSSEMRQLIVKALGHGETSHCAIKMTEERPYLIFANVHDDFGIYRQSCGILLNGWKHPIMGPSVFYCEEVIPTADGEPEQIMVDFTLPMVESEDFIFVTRTTPIMKPPTDRRRTT